MAPAPVLAHAAHGNAIGVPEWLLVATLVLAAALTWLALRTSWPAPRLEAAAAGRLLPAWTAAALRVLAAAAAVAGLAVWLLTVTAGLFATSDPTRNLAPFVVSPQFLLGGGLLVSAVIGDWWRSASPFATLARILPDRDDVAPAPSWVGPVMLGSFLWLAYAFHDGGQPRAAGTWLAAYTVAALAGAARWGRSWARSGEGFALLFATVASAAPLARDEDTGRIRLRPPVVGLRRGLDGVVGGEPRPAGAGIACLVVTGAVVFGAIRRLDWWQLEVRGHRTGWESTLVDSFGLAFVVGVAAIVWTVATRGRIVPVEPLVPVTLGIATAFLLTDALSRAVDVAALLSDPYGKGWDLFGTTAWFPDIGWQSSTRLAWTEIGALAAGAVLAVLVAHDRALATERGRAAAERAALPQIVATTLLATTALAILLR